MGVQKNSSLISTADIKQLPTEAECIANTKQIRDVMSRISESKTVIQSDLQILYSALDKNRKLFEEFREHQNIRELLFGESRGPIDDLALFYSTEDTLLLNVKINLDTNSFAASVRLPSLLRTVVIRSAEWSEYLDEMVIGFSLAAPLTMVKYLGECTQDEFDEVFGELYIYLYEIPGKRAELDSKLIEISVQEKKYTETIEKIRNRLNEDNIKYCSINNCIE